MSCMSRAGHVLLAEDIQLFVGYLEKNYSLLYKMISMLLNRTSNSFNEGPYGCLNCQRNVQYLMKYVNNKCIS